eukprot:jgi/Mesvir1/8202/Mv12494-RA.2
MEEADASIRREVEARGASRAASVPSQDAPAQTSLETADAAAQSEEEAAQPVQTPVAVATVDTAVGTDDDLCPPDGGADRRGQAVGEGIRGRAPQDHGSEQSAEETHAAAPELAAGEDRGEAGEAKETGAEAEATHEGTCRRRRLFASDQGGVADGSTGDATGEDDTNDVLVQAAQEKVDMLLLLSQEQERSRLDAANLMALAEQRDDLRRQLQQAVQEKVEALMALSDMAAMCQRAMDRESELDAEVRTLHARLQQLGDGGMLLHMPVANTPPLGAPRSTGDDEHSADHSNGGVHSSRSVGGHPPSHATSTPTRGNAGAVQGTTPKRPGEGEQGVAEKGPPAGGWASLSSVGASVSKLIKGATVAVQAVKSGAPATKASDAEAHHHASKLARLSVENASIKGRVENLRLLLASVHNLRLTLRDQARVPLDGHHESTASGRHPSSMPSPIRPAAPRLAAGVATPVRVDQRRSGAPGSLAYQPSELSHPHPQAIEGATDPLAVIERVETETLKMMHALSAVGFSSAMSPHGVPMSPNAPATVGAVYESLDGKLRKLEMHPEGHRGHWGATPQDGGLVSPGVGQLGPGARGELEFDTEAGLEMAELLLQCCVLRKVILSSNAQGEEGGPPSDNELPTSYGSLNNSDSPWQKKS